MGPGEIAVRTEPCPTLAPDEVLVKMVMSAISAGTEMLFYRGLVPAHMVVDEMIPSLGGKFAYPLSYGYVAVGRVVAVGQGVEAQWLGRLVFAFQPHADYFVAKPTTLWSLPPGMAAETALFLPNMETAVSFVMDGIPIIGERVFVFGQGVVGLLTTTLLSAYPLAELVTFDSYALRREQALRLGATACLEPTTARELMGTADLVYELSGQPQALDQAIACVGFNGRVVVGSWYGRKPVQLNLGGAFHRNHIQLISSQVSQLAPRWRGRWDKNRRLQLAWHMLATYQPQHLITHYISFTNAPQAYQLLDEQPENTLQVVLTYD